ncbi:unnamed protein product [Rotaria socialis]|uniref:Uncharacterized protein n=1 Tax=Rotaria socialis TaxID=392032 RepID=A0A821DM28_9BILA|nr:unnamed protein product [Rotaria socialis]
MKEQVIFPIFFINVSESNNTAIVPLIPNAVLDVNGTNISSDDVAEHLFDRMKFQTAEQTRGLASERSIQKDTVYMIPRGNRPVNEYSNPNILLGILPALFPYGCGAIEDDSRSVQIDFREHLRYLIVFRNRRFEEHYSFIFVVFNILQHRTACFHAHLMTLIRYFQQSAQLLESLSSADIATALVNISKGTYSNIADQRINTLMKHIRGVLWYCKEPRQSIHRHSANCYKYSKAKPDGLKTCRMRVPRALVENSHIDVSTGQIAMHRSHPWINNFNEWLINACRCNMDIKFIWAGSDAKALVYYITD